jgi:signal transduction histidine kinase
MHEPGIEAENGVMDGLTLTTGQPGRASLRHRARSRWPGPARLLREPFTRRAWAEFGYAIACVPLAVAGFVFTVGTLVIGAGLTLTIVGVVIGPLLIAASTPGVRGLGGATRWLARRLLGIKVTGPPPPRRNPGVTGWFWSALNDANAWRTRGYLALKLPVSLLAGYVAGWFWLGGLAYLTYPLWWEIFHRIGYRADGVTHPDPVTNPGPFGSVHVLTLPGSFALIPVGVVALLAAPWVTRAVVALDRALIRRLLGPVSMSERVVDLERTRAHAVDDSAARLRQIERDLHDGAQAQLVAVAMRLGLAKEKLRGAGAAAPGQPARDAQTSGAGHGQPDIDRAFELVDAAQRTAREAIAELRDLARGIHPPVLDRGLDAALATLAARSAVPVDLVVDVPQRPSPAIETIAYFCTAELLANVAKHSGAPRASVEVVHVPGLLRVRVSDTGEGGARPVPGSGLAGLAERVRTVDGRLDISSPRGGPTVVTAELPSHA